MFTLYFSTGNSQAYPDLSCMLDAAKAMGGEAKRIKDKIYVFVPKK